MPKHCQKGPMAWWSRHLCPEHGHTPLFFIEVFSLCTLPFDSLLGFTGNSPGPGWCGLVWG